MILGHLIPAGTGFRVFQEAEVKYRREALEELAGAGVQSLEESFPLLDEGSEGALPPSASPEPAPFRDAVEPSGSEQTLAEPPAVAEQPAAEPPASDALDSMFGGGQD